ncbi:unnamed protein product [Onchocerca flexuosa]|uniref:Secreted protein n=1 Tax=Onchocerca flexuosa TaxID=387005 RepID=A0A183HZH2_9BILA|nr:unnamed protein product [Onchocerca flexuosa]
MELPLKYCVLRYRKRLITKLGKLNKMLLLIVFLILAPALSFGMNSLGYGWSIPPYGAANGGYGYAYGNQPYASSYYQPQPYSYTSNLERISHGFRNYIYPAYYYLPRFRKLRSLTSLSKIYILEASVESLIVYFHHRICWLTSKGDGNCNNLSNLLKSGAYGALKGAGAGAAIGGIVGLLG